jgi:hypothetical protein
MMADFVRAGRTFQVWNFTPSHRQLVLRSNASSSEGTTTRVEVYFGHVDLVFLRTVYEGVHIRRPQPHETEELAERFAIEPDMRPDLYLIGAGHLDGFVVSGRPAWREAERLYSAPSMFDFSLEWPSGPDCSWGEVN